MIPRVVLDLEVGSAIARVLPELDLLGVAYGATRGGAEGIILPIAETGRQSNYSADLFDRPGLPLLTVKCEVTELERAAALGSAPDRLLITGDRGGCVKDFSHVDEYVSRSSGSHQEIGVLVEAETASLKALAKTGARWAYLGCGAAHSCESTEAAEAELARLTSAALSANKLGLRVALHGPTGRQLPVALGALPHVEEIAPTPDLWVSALRIGFENAVQDFIRLLH